MAAAPVRKLPVLATALETYRFLLGHPLWFLKAATVPLLLWLLIAWQIPTLRGLITPHEPSDFMNMRIWITIFIYPLQSFIYTIPETLFAVSWHRAFLFGEIAAKPKILVLWQLRHWVFLAYMIALNTVMQVFTTSFVFIVIYRTPLIGNIDNNIFQMWPYLLFIVSSLVGFYLSLRLSLVLPARAVDQDCSLGDSWRLTRGRGLRLLALSLIALLPLAGFYFAKVFFATVTPVTAGSERSAMFSLTGSYHADAYLLVASSFVSIALMVTVLSIAYRNITGLPAPQGAAAATEEETP